MSDAGASLTLAGDINGDGGLAKIGLGELILSGTNLYDGGTSVSEGRLTISDPDALPIGTNLSITGGTVVLSEGLGRAIELGGLTISLGGGPVPGPFAPAARRRPDVQHRARAGHARLIGAGLAWFFWRRLRRRKS